MDPKTPFIDKSLLREYFLKPFLFAIVIVGVFFALNQFTYFNFSLGSNNSYNSFEVVGIGKISATPNISTTTYTISETADTEEKARSLANEKQSQILSQIKTLGIADNDIKTVGFYVNPNYETESLQSGAEPLIYPPVRQVQKGYTATITTEIKSKDIEKINKSIDIATKIGATVGGVSYMFDDEEKYKMEAVNKAVESARAQAESIAKSAGFKLGKIISIRNLDDQYGYPIPYAIESTYRTDQTDLKTDLQPGQNEVSARIGVTYQIKN